MADRSDARDRSLRLAHIRILVSMAAFLPFLAGGLLVSATSITLDLIISGTGAVTSVSLCMLACRAYSRRLHAIDQSMTW